MSFHTVTVKITELPNQLGLDCISAEGLDSSECPGYDAKQSDGVVPVMLELWGMKSTTSLPSLPVPPWPGVLAPDRVLSMGQVEVNCILM